MRSYIIYIYIICHQVECSKRICLLYISWPFYLCIPNAPWLSTARKSRPLSGKSHPPKYQTSEALSILRGWWKHRFTLVKGMLYKPQNKHIANPVYLIDSIMNHHRPRPRSHHPHPHPHPHHRCRRRRHHATLLTYQPTSTNETTFQAPDIFGWGPASDCGWLGVFSPIRQKWPEVQSNHLDSVHVALAPTGVDLPGATRIANQTRRNMFHLVSSLDELNWNTRLLKPHWHKTIHPSKRRCIKFLLHHWTIAVPNPPSLLSQALHQPWHSRSIYFISPPSRMRERSLFHHTVNLCELCAHGSKKG